LIHLKKKKKFDKPTAIQTQTWPICLQGKDLIGLAETGSGKTLGFLLPGVIHLLDQRTMKKGDGPIVLVLAPTRELAKQIEEECNKFISKTKIKCCCLYGGAPKYDQKVALRKQPEICIATPGRLIDFISEGVISLNRITYLVLDEADRMLDMGFEPQIRSITGQIRPDRQTLMWSATWNQQVQGIAKDFLNDPVIVNIGSVDISANHKVYQKFVFLQHNDKTQRLLELMNDVMDGNKVLIFAGTKKSCDEICQLLREDGWPCLSIHGDKKQNEREWVLKEFKKRKLTNFSCN